MTREFTQVGVVGLGTMGAGIAEVLARSGVDVIGSEPTEAGLERARELLAHSTDRAVAGGKLTADERDALLARITLTTSLDDLAECPLVVEAVPEQFDLKVDVLAHLDKILAPDAAIVTNTSALSVTELAVSTTRPEQVLGLHFFNPAPVMGLVEVISTVIAEPGLVQDVRDLVERIGKSPATVGDRAGFIANALLFGYLNNALRMWEAGYASREDIDAAMRFGCGHAMGPLALLDLIGLDSAFHILDTIYRSGRDHLHAPAPILRQLVTAGRLGRKSGRGIYTYADVDSSEIVPDGPAVEEAPAETRPVSSVGVIGTGTMASGIVEVLAAKGLDVVFRARGEDKVAAVSKKITASLDKQVAKGRLTEDARSDILGRITGTTELEALAGCDLVIEAVVEELGVKRALFSALDDICKPGAILATTTSSLPVIECAMATSRPGDVIGMHWFNPAPLMKLVEVVPTVLTADDVTATVTQLTRQLGKHPVQCGDRAGFIVNALLFPYLNDAVKMLEAHYATADDIDTAMKTGCRHPMGPFELMDVVGLDVTLAIQRVLFEEFREPGYSPAPLLEHLVTAGYLGRKTGRGFRSYAR